MTTKTKDSIFDSAVYKNAIKTIATSYTIKLGGYVSERQALEYKKKSMLFRNLTEEDRQEGLKRGIVY